MEIETLFPVRGARWKFLRLDWQCNAKYPSYQDGCASFEFLAEYRLAVHLAQDHPSGACILSAETQTQTYAQVIIVNARDSAVYANVVVIRPSFTEWGYHRDGFYWNEQRRLGDKIVRKICATVPGSGRVLFPLCNLFPKQLRYPYFNPANELINLERVYETNPRWLKAGHWAASEVYFDGSALALPPEHSTWPGMWTEDVKSTLPTYALLQHAGLRFHTATDVDVHRGSDIVTNARVLLFYAQELMTREYFENLADYLQSRGRRVVLFGVQGMGYKEVTFSEGDGTLYFLGEKSPRVGLSGEVTSGVLPSWGRRDAEVFGFEFPQPFPGWRQMAHKLKIRDPNHWLIQGMADQFTYEIADPDGTIVPGLTRAGGEYFRQTRDDARVIATLDDSDLVGFGVYGNLVVLSPTYWPSFGFYQADAHPEVVEILRRAVVCPNQ
jgi:hypothetical protein